MERIESLVIFFLIITLSVAGRPFKASIKLLLQEWLQFVEGSLYTILISNNGKKINEKNQVPLGKYVSSKHS